MSRKRLEKKLIASHKFFFSNGDGDNSNIFEKAKVKSKRFELHAQSEMGAKYPERNISGQLPEEVEAWIKDVIFDFTDEQLKDAGRERRYSILISFYSHK